SNIGTFGVENPTRPCEQPDLMHKPLLRRALRAGSPGPSVREAYVKLDPCLSSTDMSTFCTGSGGLNLESVAPRHKNCTTSL
ncbi:hypothetical protein PCASD_26114, partial [Puccinia coronata f. sp. avenae]